jgi:hypothetical protein
MPRIEATHFIEVFSGYAGKTHNTHLSDIHVLNIYLKYTEFHPSTETVAIWKIKFKTQ